MKRFKILIVWLLVIGQPDVLFCDYVMMVLFAGTGNSKVFQMDDNGVMSHQYDLILTDRNEPMELCFSPDGRWGLVGYDMTQSKPETHITTLLNIDHNRIIHVQNTIDNKYGKFISISPDSEYGIYGGNLKTLKYINHYNYNIIPTDNKYIAHWSGGFSKLNNYLYTDDIYRPGIIQECTITDDGKTTTTGVVVDISPATAFQGVYVSPDGKTCIALSTGTYNITSLRINKDVGLSLAHQYEHTDSSPVDIGFTPNSCYFLVSFFDCDGSDGGELRSFSIDDESKISFVNSINLPQCPHRMAVTPDGKYAVIAGVLLGTTYFCVVEINEDGTLTYLPEKDFEYPGLINKFAFVPPYKGEGTSFMVY